MNRFLRSICFLAIAAAALSGTALATVLAPRSEDVQNTKLRWKSTPIRISLSTSLTKPNSSIKADSDVAGAIARSFEVWEKAGGFSFELSWSDRTGVSPAGPTGDGANLITIAQTPENLLLFSKDAGDVSGRTRVFYSGKGAITEADIVLNPYQQFSTDGSIGTFDLESTLIHEIGHLLGLEHSPVFGSTMHENYGRNGVFSLQSLSARTLSREDIVSLWSLYGSSGEDDGCCGGIAGKISTIARQARSFQVWAEDIVTGSVIAQAPVAADGTFKIDGLPAGQYRLMAQGTSAKNPAPTESLGRYTVEKGKIVSVSKRFANRSSGPELKYTGFNGQLSELAVSLNRGRSYTVYIGGRNISSGKFNLEINSPFFNIVPESISTYDYSEDLSVISFEVRVLADAPNGEYSISLRGANGERRTLIGALTLEDFVNPWSTSILSD